RQARRHGPGVLAEAAAVVVVLIQEEQAEALAPVPLRLDRSRRGAAVEELLPQGLHVADVEITRPRRGGGVGRCDHPAAPHPVALRGGGLLVTPHQRHVLLSAWSDGPPATRPSAAGRGPSHSGRRPRRRPRRGSPGTARPGRRTRPGTTRRGWGDSGPCRA